MLSHRKRRCTGARTEWEWKEDVIWKKTERIQRSCAMEISMRVEVWLCGIYTVGNFYILIVPTPRNQCHVITKYGALCGAITNYHLTGYAANDVPMRDEWIQYGEDESPSPCTEHMASTRSNEIAWKLDEQNVMTLWVSVPEQMRNGGRHDDNGSVCTSICIRSNQCKK